MQVRNRLDPDVLLEFSERTKSKVSYMFKMFPSNQTSLEFSSISVTEMIGLEALLLLIAVMTLHDKILTAESKQNKQQCNAHKMRRYEGGYATM
jgi:hypothetical protein